MCEGRQVQVKRKASLRLLLYLIVHFGRRVSQDVLLEELFPDVALAAAQNQLNVALSVLRSALQPDRTRWRGRKSGYLLSGEGLYWLDPELVSLDADDFVKRSEPKGNTEIVTGKLLAAQQLYRGELLGEYPYEPFIIAERERLRIRYMQVLNTLAVHYAAQGDGYRSMEYYEKLCASDPHHLQNHKNYLRMLEHHQFRSKAAVVTAHIQRISQEW
jgi:LuxR family maltose regulon positive regulatory protein